MHPLGSRPRDGAQEDTVGKQDRGFASMDRNRQREIASQGGRAAHKMGTAHEWTREEAREAGRKGGIASHLLATAAKATTDGDDVNPTADHDEVSPMEGQVSNLAPHERSAP